MFWTWTDPDVQIQASQFFLNDINTNQIDVGTNFIVTSQGRWEPVDLTFLNSAVVCMEFKADSECRDCGIQEILVNMNPEFLAEYFTWMTDNYYQEMTFQLIFSEGVYLSYTESIDKCGASSMIPAVLLTEESNKRVSILAV